MLGRFDCVQIIQINSILKNSSSTETMATDVQIIQINSILKNAWQGWILLHPFK